MTLKFYIFGLFYLEFFRSYMEFSVSNHLFLIYNGIVRSKKYLKLHYLKKMIRFNKKAFEIGRILKERR
jgi:hypothetical protein